MSPERLTEDVNFDPTVPLHHQIYLQLRHEIEDGLWAGSESFPGEREVGERFGASAVTARTALGRLRDDGWIRRQRGRRPEVIYDAGDGSKDKRPSLVPVGRVRPYTYEVLFAEIRVAPADACFSFGMHPGSELWQCSRLRTYEAKPHSVTLNAQLPEIGRRHTKRALKTRPMFELLAEQGSTISQMRRRMRIGQAGTEVTSALGLSLAEPVLITTFTLHDPDDELIQWVRIFLHPDHSTPEETMDLATGSWSATETM